MSKELKELKDELVAIKKLLVLGLQNSGIKGTHIAKALGISTGRLSQILPTKEYKKKK